MLSKLVEALRHYKLGLEPWRIYVDTINTNANILMELKAHLAWRTCCQRKATMSFVGVFGVIWGLIEVKSLSFYFHYQSKLCRIIMGNLQGRILQPSECRPTTETDWWTVGVFDRLNIPIGCRMIMGKWQGRIQQPSEWNEHTIKVNWRVVGVFEQLQRQTGSLCWLFVVVELLEVRYYILHGVRIHLSKQELLDKAKPSAVIGDTYPFEIDSALSWVQRFGLSLEEDYPPFVGEKQMPFPRSGNPVFRLQGFKVIGYHEEEEIKRHLRVSPVAALMRLERTEYLRLLELPTPEIYAPIARIQDRRRPRLIEVPPLRPGEPRGPINHAILLTGYDLDSRDHVYEARDPLESWAPGMGHYPIKMHSSVRREELTPVYDVYSVTDVCMEEGPRKFNIKQERV